MGNLADAQATIVPQAVKAAFGSLAVDVSDWDDPLWRLNNLYEIVTDDGKVTRFKTNEHQERLYREMWFLNICLKARQLGMTTFIDMMGLDLAIFNDTQAVAIIAHGLEEATKIFRNKIEFPYQRLPEQLKAARTLVSDTAKELLFDNGSSVQVATSVRSGTVQFLHVSEFGKISRKYPEKAREIVTGSFNAVHPGQYIFVESTAEGRDGHFYRMVEAAQKAAERNEALTPLSFKLHFFPWWEHQSYRLAAGSVYISDELDKYFDSLAADHGIVLEPEQQAWYAAKFAQLGEQWEDMKREFPATPEEAFEVAGEGVYYRKELARARREGRVRDIPVLPHVPVDTFWDIGHDDQTAIWCMQRVGWEFRFIKTYSNDQEDVTHYVQWLQKQPWILGTFYMPHDAANKYFNSNKSAYDVMTLDLRIPAKRVVIVDRIDAVMNGINATRRLFPAIHFDRRGCEEGLLALEDYQRKWDDRQGCWKDEPLRNGAQHYADAIRQFGQSHAGLRPPVKHPDPTVPGVARKKAKPKLNWRTT